MQEVSPVPIGINLTLVKHLLKHQDLKKILEKIRIMGKKTLIIIHHDTETIWRVFKRLEGDMSHHWWDVLFGWSPEATGILSAFVYPIIVLLILMYEFDFVYCNICLELEDAMTSGNLNFIVKSIEHGFKRFLSHDLVT